MAKEKKQAEERAEAEDTLRSMISDLNELPTDVLQQLSNNLDRIEAFNKKHNLNTGSSHGAYLVADLEELLELNEIFLSICLLYDHIPTRRVAMDAPLKAILLFQSEDDVIDLAGDRSWIDHLANAVSYSVDQRSGYYAINFVSDWNLKVELDLISLDSLKKGLPADLKEDLSHGCRVSMHRGNYDESFFEGLLK